MLKNLIKTGFMYLDTYEVLKLIGDQEKIDALLQGQVKRLCSAECASYK